MMEINTDIIVQFRVKYPYFNSQENYPDSVITLALGYSDDQTNSRGWGSYENLPTNLKQNGMFSWSANWLAVTYPNGASNPEDMNPFPEYIVNSKSVGDESVSYSVDSIPATDQFLLKTVWGQQFMGYKMRAARAQGFVVV